MRGRRGPSWSVRVNTTPEKAWDYVADISRHAEWGMDDMTVTPEEDGPAKVGSRYKAEGTLLGKPNPSVVTVTELAPPGRLEFEAEDSRGISGHVFTFATNGGTTTITRTLYGVKQPFIGPILFLVFRGAINKNFNGALRNLKQKLERS
ncbi:MAG: SRPBCC family protein [Candidatus Dormibacteria bacterium]